MDKNEPFDWDPRSDAVQRDQIAAYDAMRARCPVARSRYGYTSLFRHADILQVLQDPDTFSSEVSRHVAVPNGMDPPRHTACRQLIDGFFTPQCMAQFQPVCQQIALALADALPRAGDIDAMREIAWPFAIRAQCAFMGWPASLQQPLRQWTRKNHAATFAIDPDAMGAVAREFDGYLDELLQQRRAMGSKTPDDVTTRLMRAEIDGRALTDAEIKSIARNWTVGELSTIAASVGILLEYLCRQPRLQQQLREDSELLPEAVNEILRLHGPLVFNRRRVTRPMLLGGRRLEIGERLALIWPSANRDEAVFDAADQFRFGRDPRANLLYGAGIHVCPGAPLAELELSTLLQALLRRTAHLDPIAEHAPTAASYPASGYASVPVRVHKG
jgi:cytochrome P450